MNTDDFIELQILVGKLKVASRNAAISDKTFKKYHQSSLDFLEVISQHLTALQQGLSVARPCSREEINQKQGAREKQLNSFSRSVEQY